jgi:hypothetical protein
MHANPNGGRLSTKSFTSKSRVFVRGEHSWGWKDYMKCGEILASDQILEHGALVLLVYIMPNSDYICREAKPTTTLK